jgi:hypothetical protein
MGPLNQCPRGHLILAASSGPSVDASVYRPSISAGRPQRAVPDLSRYAGQSRNIMWFPPGSCAGVREAQPGRPAAGARSCRKERSGWCRCSRMRVFPGLVDHYFTADQLVAAAFGHPASKESNELFDEAEAGADAVIQLKRLISEWMRPERDEISLLWLDAWQARSSRTSSSSGSTAVRCARWSRRQPPRGSSAWSTR